jgi:Putative 2/3 transmembrane domain holin
MFRLNAASRLNFVNRLPIRNDEDPMKKIALYDWALFAVVLVGWVYWLNPADGPTLIYKASKLAMAVILGRWLHWALFPYGRPDKLVDPDEDGKWETGEAIVFATAMLCQAVIIWAAVTAMNGL